MTTHTQNAVLVALEGAKNRKLRNQTFYREPSISFLHMIDWLGLSRFILSAPILAHPDELTLYFLDQMLHMEIQLAEERGRELQVACGMFIGWTFLFCAHRCISSVWGWFLQATTHHSSWHLIRKLTSGKSCRMFFWCCVLHQIDSIRMEDNNFSRKAIYRHGWMTCNDF